MIIHFYTPDLHNCCSLFQALFLLFSWQKIVRPPEFDWDRSSSWLLSMSNNTLRRFLIGPASPMLTYHWSKAVRVIVAILPFIFAEFVWVRASWCNSHEHQKYLVTHSSLLHSRAVLYLPANLCTMYISLPVLWTLYKCCELEHRRKCFLLPLGRERQKPENISIVRNDTLKAARFIHALFEC